jgi:4-hydroxy-4-methyl-2-oxoglutarate aldolase
MPDTKVCNDPLNADIVDMTGVPGFCVAPHGATADRATIAALGEVPVAALGDVLGRRGIMDAGIKPLSDMTRIAGPALTVETRPGDNLMLHAALKIARPGDILVVNGHGYAEAAVWGMLMTHTAIAVQLGGLIIDGALRDRQEIVASGFAAYTRWICAAGPHKDGPGQVNLPVACGGVAVRSGDVIVGDADGIVVIAAEDAGFALHKGRAKVAAEDRRAREINEDGVLHQGWLIPTLSKMGLFGTDGAQ